MKEDNYENEYSIKRWDIFNTGIFLFTFNEDFVEKVLTHPKVIKAYEEWKMTNAKTD